MRCSRPSPSARSIYIDWGLPEDCAIPVRVICKLHTLSITRQHLSSCAICRAGSVRSALAFATIGRPSRYPGRHGVSAARGLEFRMTSVFGWVRYQSASGKAGTTAKLGAVSVSVRTVWSLLIGGIGTSRGCDDSPTTRLIQKSCRNLVRNMTRFDCPSAWPMYKKS